MRSWGLSPAEVKDKLRQSEWLQRGRLQQRLLGERPLPLVVSLRPPNSREALADVEALRQFIAHWHDWSGPGEVIYQSRQFRALGVQLLPARFEIHSLAQLFSFLGSDVEAQMDALQRKIKPLLALDASLHPVLMGQLKNLQNISPAAAAQMAALLPQLQPALGHGQYLRALPVNGVDTKFIETHFQLIESLVEHLHGDEVERAGGLLPWLQCLDKPSGWLTVRPLCQSVQRQLHQLPLLQIDSATLQHCPLPGDRIIVVENNQSALALPMLANTLAISGGGHNLSWMQADWLADREIAYWGDIDSHGLAMLDRALAAQRHAAPLLMDRAVFDAHPAGRSSEQAPVKRALPHLGQEQQALYQRLIRQDIADNRLEQEKIPAEVIRRAVESW